MQIRKEEKMSKKLSKVLVTMMLIAAMSVMYVMSAFAATGVFYVSKDGGATYEKAPSHAQNTINSVDLKNGRYKITFKKINWWVAKGEITEFNNQAVTYTGDISNTITGKYIVADFNLKGGGTITGTAVQFKIDATVFGKPHDHAYNNAVLVIK